MPTPHKHAAIIKAWADGLEVEYKNGNQWLDATTPRWNEESEYRIKPAAPKWPQTTMTPMEITQARWPKGIESIQDQLYGVASAAIAHACEIGQVVPADKVREIEAKAYEEGVKEGAERGLDKAIRATLNHVNFAVDGIK